MISISVVLALLSAVKVLGDCPGVGQACFCGDCTAGTSVSSVGIVSSNGFCNTVDGVFCGTVVEIAPLPVCSVGSCDCCPYTSGALPTKELCFDGVDNNGDGLVDCADPQCDAQLCIPPGAQLAGFEEITVLITISLPLGETDTSNLPSINACNRNVCSKNQCIPESNLLEGKSCCNSAAFIGSTLEGLCTGAINGTLPFIVDAITAIHGGDSLISTNDEKCHLGACTGCLNPAFYGGFTSDQASIDTLCDGAGFNTLLAVSAAVADGIVPLEAYRGICLSVLGPDARGRVLINDTRILSEFAGFVVNDFDVRGVNITQEYVDQFKGLTYTVQTATNANGAHRIELLCDPSVQVCTAQQIVLSGTPSCFAEFITNGDGSTLVGGDKREVKDTAFPPLPAVLPAATVIVGGSVLSTNPAVFAAITPI